MGVGVFFAEKRGWVGTENAFFICFGMSGHDLPHPRRSLHTPQVETPAPAHPDGLHITGSKTGRTRCRADHTRHDTHAQTLDTLHRSALNTRQAAPDRSWRRRGWRACNPSIMCIMIALSQAWYIDSRLYKYHTNILLHLVIVNYYLSIDIPSY